ncbi:ABC transporter permease [Paenibacillus pectinilyticus]|uniref:ABC transporter permease n=1 Tax=Paenibacillus pectinilyticus TaxID=512399 RepID=A0A1C0ZWV3_9BACL|nr:carbohydrate ABC transporter permease [Paenibacillus pectinilyticus]OCT12591.1 ABC transporter permease [Paenibacillus pectinilyticus]
MAHQRSFAQWLMSAIGLLAGAVALFPLVWMFLAGFKSEDEVLSTPVKLLPTHWLLENYKSILTDNHFTISLFMTFLGAIISTFLCLCVNSTAAYAFARLEFRFKKLIWSYMIVTMFIPAIAVLVPQFVIVSKLGILNTLTVLIIPGVAQAIHIFFLRQFYLNTPKALEEAALIDGANRYQIYYYLFLPLSKGPFTIVGIAAFLGYWNNFIWPVMTVSDERLFQVQQLLASFSSLHKTEWSLLMAGATVVALPPIILFFIFQRHIIQGIKISGLK